MIVEHVWRVAPSHISRPIIDRISLEMTTDSIRSVVILHCALCGSIGRWHHQSHAQYQRKVREKLVFQTIKIFKLLSRVSSSMFLFLVSKTGT